MIRKSDLLDFWEEAGKETKSKVFFYTKFKEWLDSQPDTPVEGQNLPQEGSEDKKRTDSQNRSIHLWLELVAAELDKNGQTVQNIVEKIKKAEIRPNKTVLKEVLWRPYQIAALHKESTTDLTKHEVDKVYEGLNKFLGQEFEIHVPFPSDETKTRPILEAMKIEDKLPEYPEYLGGPVF